MLLRISSSSLPVKQMHALLSNKRSLKKTLNLTLGPTGEREKHPCRNFGPDPADSSNTSLEFLRSTVMDDGEAVNLDGFLFEGTKKAGRRLAIIILTSINILSFKKNIKPIFSRQVSPRTTREVTVLSPKIDQSC
jgi:hypothetical protein